MKVLENSVLIREVVQGILAVGVTAGIFALAFTGREINPQLWAGWGLIVGFFFGGLVRRNGGEVAARKIEAAIAARGPSPSPPAPTG